MEIEGMTPEEVGMTLMQLQVDISSDDGYSHFERVITEKGLTRVVPEEGLE